MFPVSADVCKSLQEYPVFVELYHRNDRALDTKFTDISGFQQKMIRDDMFRLPHGKFLTKMVLHLKVTVNQIWLILYQVYRKKKIQWGLLASFDQFTSPVTCIISQEIHGGDVSSSRTQPCCICFDSLQSTFRIFISKKKFYWLLPSNTNIYVRSLIVWIYKS